MTVKSSALSFESSLSLTSACNKALDTDARFRRTQWRMLWLSVFCYTFYNLGRQNYGFAIPGMRDTFQVSTTKTGFVAGAMLLCYGVGQAINGNLSDKFGARKLVLAGTILSCAFNWIASFSMSMTLFLFPWCLNGYAQSLGFAPGGRLISNWWGQKEQGRAFGLYLFATGFSSVCAFAFSIFTLMYLSWEWLFRIPPLIMAMVGLIYYFYVRDTPEELGFNSPHPEDDETSHNKISAQDANHTLPTTDCHLAQNESFWQRYYVVLSNKKFLLISFAMGFCSIARYGLLFWVPMHFIGKGWHHDPKSGFVTIALPLGMALGTLFVGETTDKIFKSNHVLSVTVFSSIGAVLSLLLYVIPISVPVLSTFLLFFAGFFIYGPQAALFSMCPELVGQRHTGTALGLMNASAYGFASLSEPLIGMAIDYTGNTGVPFFVVAVAAIISVLAVLCLIPMQRAALRESLSTV